MKDADDEVVCLIYQYKNARNLWNTFSCTLLKAILEIRTWPQLCQFWTALGSKLGDIYQQAGLYWELAEDGFWKLKPTGKNYVEVKKYREKALELDRRAGEVLNAFQAVFVLMQRNRIISHKQVKEICARAAK